MFRVEDERLYRYIGSRIKAAREAAHPKIPQSKLAAAVNVERTSITNIENGNQRPSIFLIYEICAYLKLSPAHVFPPIHEVIAKRTSDSAEMIEPPLATSTVERLRQQLRAVVNTEGDES